MTAEKTREGKPAGIRQSSGSQQPLRPERWSALAKDANLSCTMDCSQKELFARLCALALIGTWLLPVPRVPRLDLDESWHFVFRPPRSTLKSRATCIAHFFETLSRPGALSLGGPQAPLALLFFGVFARRSPETVRQESREWDASKLAQGKTPKPQPTAEDGTAGWLGEFTQPRTCPGPQLVSAGPKTDQRAFIREKRCTAKMGQSARPKGWRLGLP